VSARNNVDLEQDPRSIIATRVLDAPRELVWTAWTKPEHLAQWWGPDGFSTTTSAYDLRPGGVWRWRRRSRRCRRRPPLSRPASQRCAGANSLKPCWRSPAAAKA